MTGIGSVSVSCAIDYTAACFCRASCHTAFGYGFFSLTRRGGARSRRQRGTPVSAGRELLVRQPSEGPRATCSPVGRAHPTAGRPCGAWSRECPSQLVENGRLRSWTPRGTRLACEWCMLQHFRSALRSLRHAPGFSLAAILTFAIGIGATTAIFTVLHAVLLRPLPYTQPGRLVVLLHDGQFPVSPADYLDYRRELRAYDGISAAQAWSATIAAGDGAERLPGLQVTPDLFRILGVRAAIGRTFLPGENQPGRNRVVVLSDALWKRRFGGDRAIVGREMVLDGEPFTVVGVMPPAFRFAPFWATTATLWRPLSLAARSGDRGGRSLRLFARLRDGVSRETATAGQISLRRTDPGA